MDNSQLIYSKEKVKFRKGKRYLSFANLDIRKSKMKLANDKKHLPLLNPSFAVKSPDKLEPIMNSSFKSQSFIEPERNLPALLKLFETKLEEKLRCIDKKNYALIVKAHLDIFEKIIIVDSFGPLLEKIWKVLVNFIGNSHASVEHDVDILKQSEQEITHLKDTLKDLENSKKNNDSKLKRLSIENIELLEKIDKLEEENELLKDFRKNVKIVDGIPDTLPILKELKTKSTVLDSLDKKNKELEKKLKFLQVLSKVLKERGLNPKDLVNSYLDKKVSNSSLNVSRMSFYSDISKSFN